MAIPEDNGQVRATIWPPVEIVALMALQHGMVSNKFEKEILKISFSNKFEKEILKILAGNQVDHVILLLPPKKNYYVLN